MIGNKLELSIVGIFQDDLSATYSINKVSKLLKKSYPIINRKSNLFLEEGILKKMDIGRSYQCFLNFGNDKARALMTLNEIGRKEIFLRRERNSDMLIEEISQLAAKFPIETAILYKHSLIFVTPQPEIKGEVMRLSILTKDYTMLFLDKGRFQQFFLDNKDFQKYHIILHNADVCINMISVVADRLVMSGILGNTQDKSHGERNGSKKDGVKHK